MSRIFIANTEHGPSLVISRDDTLPEWKHGDWMVPADADVDFHLLPKNIKVFSGTYELDGRTLIEVDTAVLQVTEKARAT